MKKVKTVGGTGLAALLFFLALAIPVKTLALSGVKIKNTKIKVDAKMDGHWFRALKKRTDNKGVLTLRGVLPGWYRMRVGHQDEKDGQSLALKARMVDPDGRPINHKTDVKLYVKNDGEKVMIGTVTSDEEGWISLSGLSLDTEYKLVIDEDDTSHLSHKNRPRIKVRAKIGKSDWFRSAYRRTHADNVLKIKNILPGKYKFSYKNGDAPVGLPFTLRIRMLDSHGNRIKEATHLRLYAYQNGQRVVVGDVITDNHGWVTIPGVMTKMTYKISIVN